MRIFCLGDSLTRGFGVRESESYPAQLQVMLRARGVVAEVTNCGINGLTAGELLHIQERLLQNAIPGDRVLLMIGTNDALNLHLPVERYRQILDDLATRIQVRGLQLYLATLPPVDLGYIFFDNANRRLAKYNSAIRESAAAHQSILVENAGIDVNLLSDGVHFSPTGYGQIAEKWRNALTDNATKG